MGRPLRKVLGGEAELGGSFETQRPRQTPQAALTCHLQRKVSRRETQWQPWGGAHGIPVAACHLERTMAQR